MTRQLVVKCIVVPYVRNDFYLVGKIAILNDFYSVNDFFLFIIIIYSANNDCVQSLPYIYFWFNLLFIGQTVLLSCSILKFGLSFPSVDVILVNSNDP